MRGYKSFGSNPHPGDLRHRIVIGRTENHINENGYPEPVDIQLHRVWAAITEAGNQNFRSADALNAERVLNFTVRYLRDVEEGMWVLHEGHKWVISTVDKFDFKKSYLGLKANLPKGVSG